MKDLGFANGWRKSHPIEIKVCKTLGHKLKIEKVGNCLTKVSCPICDYFYKIDSGD